MINTERLFKGRINRRDFIIGTIIFSFLRGISILPVLAVFFMPILKGEIGYDIPFLAAAMVWSASIFTPEGIISTLLALVVVLSSLGIYARRLHDVGMPTKFASIILIDYLVGIIYSNINVALISSSRLPINEMWSIISSVIGFMAIFTILYLVFKKGQPDANEYGPVPTERRSIKEIMLGE